jgi:hypothetical protein
LTNKWFDTFVYCIDCEQPSSTASLRDTDQQHYPIATTSGSVRSTTSSSSTSSSIQQQQQQQHPNFYEPGII